MSRKLILIIVIIFIIIITIILSRQETPPTPVIPLPSSSVTPSPPKIPKTFQYDGSTDLKKELDNINPQVLDSDFNE